MARSPPRPRRAGGPPLLLPPLLLLLLLALTAASEMTTPPGTAAAAREGEADAHVQLIATELDGAAGGDAALGGAAEDALSTPPPPPTTTATAATQSPSPPVVNLGAHAAGSPLATASTAAKNSTAGLAEDLRDQVGVRIVEGFEAEPGRYEYMANIAWRSDGGIFCGGTLIAPKVVLTAAHCHDTDAWKVYIGRHNAFTGTAGVDFEEINVVRKLKHPKYNDDTEAFDVMLLMLASASTVTPVLIDNAGAEKLPLSRRKPLNAMGWGKSEDYSWDTFPTLQDVVLNYMTNSQCTNTGFGRREIKSNMMCAKKAGKDTCQGDSGGPLISKGGRANRDVQVGVTSWGYGCAGDTAGVYHRLSTSRRWIENKLADWGQSLRKFIACKDSVGSIVTSNGGRTAKCRTSGGNVVASLSCSTQVVQQRQQRPAGYIATCSTTDTSNLQTHSDPVSTGCCSDFPNFSSPGARGSASVCGGSRLPGVGCPQAGTYWEARSICADAGARLCTLQELEDGEAAGTGCGLDGNYVWTSTQCYSGPDRWINAEGQDASDPDCDRPSAYSLGVRCCADVC